MKNNFFCTPHLRSFSLIREESSYPTDTGKRTKKMNKASKVERLMDKVGPNMGSPPKDHICQFLEQILSVRGESTFTVAGDRSKSGVEFVNSVLELANGLVELGISNGDVVAIASLNSEWYMEWLMAVAYVGAIVAPLNYRWSLEEAREAVELVRPVMVVVDDNCSKWVAGLQVPSVMFRVLIGEFNAIIDCDHNERMTNAGYIKGPAQRLDRFKYQWAPRDVVLVCFTSGTTGRPKGVAISHTALVMQARAKITVVGYSDDDVYLHTAPLCHIGGLSSCIAMLMAGGCHVFIPRFDAKAAAKSIEENQVTALITVPAMLSDMITVLRRQSRVHFVDSSVKKVLNGGGSLSSELISGATCIFPNATLISAYGMTEACSSLTFITLYDPKSATSWHNPSTRSSSINDPVTHLGGSCVGRPPPHIELQILRNGNDDDTQPVPVAGRILTRGSHVMVGYWDSNSTSKREKSVVSGHGDWLDTGDIGWIDVDGNLWLLGRTNSKIKSGGENVYPEEVESVLSQHPGVLDAAVFGIPDHRLSEMVVACVRPIENWEWIDQKKDISPDMNELSREILHKYCIQRNLTRFKMPKLYIPWRKPFPCTSTGKLKREEVRKEVMLCLLNFLPSNL